MEVNMGRTLRHSRLRAAALAVLFTALALSALAVAVPAARASSSPPRAPGPLLRDQSASGAGGNISGCSGTAVSRDEDGATIDSVSGPGAPPASRGNALKVDYDGVVSYDGSTDNLIKNHNWDISIFGIPVKSGGDTNEEERIRDVSDEQVSDYLPFRMSGKYYVSFQISGEGGSCSGSLWVEIDENPVGTIPWVVGTGFLLLGVAGLAFSVPTGAAAAAATAAGGATAAPDPVIGGVSGPTAPADGPVIGGPGPDAGPPPPADDDTVIGG
jgi:hypothetical protein